MALDPDLSLLSYDFDGNFVGEFTPAVSQLELEHVEGPFRASWVFDEREGDLGHTGLRGWFYNKLMSQVAIVYKGEQVWAGYIWEMELEIGKMVLKRSMTDFANAFAVTFTDPDEDDSPYLDFADYGEPTVEGISIDEDDSHFLLADESIKQYGRQEIILTSNGNSSEAHTLAEVRTKKLPDPYNYAIVYKPPSKARLRVTAVGRMVIANKFIMMDDRLRKHPDYEDMSYEDTVRDGEEWTVGDEVKRIVDLVHYNTGWLYPQRIAANDTPTKAGSTGESGAFDRLVELTQLWDSEKNFYQLTVLDDGGVIYDKYDEAPAYVLKTAETGVEYFDGTVPKWQARPGVIKDIAGGAGPILPTSWLSDDRLIPIERTTMREGDEFASFNARTIDVVDFQNALMANLRAIKELDR